MPVREEQRMPNKPSENGAVKKREKRKLKSTLNEWKGHFSEVMKCLISTDLQITYHHRKD